MTGCRERLLQFFEHGLRDVFADIQVVPPGYLEPSTTGVFEVYAAQGEATPLGRTTIADDVEPCLVLLHSRVMRR